jgi:hypothetical protein
MKIELKSLLLCGLFLSSSWVCPSAQAFEVSGFAVGNLAFPNITALGTTGSTSGFSTGFGALLGYELAPGFTLELGGVYRSRQYGVSGGSANQNEMRLDIPLLLRLDLPFIQPFIGPYYSTGIGNMTASGVSLSYAANSLSTSDYGLLLGVGHVFEVVPNIGIMVRGQFMFGFPNISTNPLFTLSYRDVQLLGGITLRL